MLPLPMEGGWEEAEPLRFPGVQVLEDVRGWREG